MAGWRSHTGEGCILLPQCVLTIWGGPFYKPSGSPHTWISQTELKQPHGCHLCGDTRTDTNVHTRKSASASQLHTLQMMKLIVSHCLMEHVVFLLCDAIIFHGNLYMVISRTLMKWNECAMWKNRLNKESWRSLLFLCHCWNKSLRFVAFSVILLKGYWSLTVHSLSIKLKVVKRVKHLVDQQADITVSSLLRLKLG